MFLCSEGAFVATSQKKAPSEHKTMWNTYTSGSEKACEKSTKKVVPTSLDLSLLYTITFCKNCKLLTRDNSKRFWRGQMANVHHSDLSVVCETRFFEKKRKIQKKVKSAIWVVIRMRAAKKKGLPRRPKPMYWQGFIFKHFFLQNTWFALRPRPRTCALPKREGPWGGRRPGGKGVRLFLNKTCFSKKLDFLSSHSDLNTGCQYWRIPEDAESTEVTNSFCCFHVRFLRWPPGAVARSA